MTIRIRDKITMMRDVVNIYGESGPENFRGWEKDNAEVKNS